MPNLESSEREALIHFSKIGSESLGKHVPAEFAGLQLEAKRCTAWHSSGEEQGLLDSIHMTTAGLAAHVEGLNDRVDQAPPQLTFIGEMLHTSCIESGVTEPRSRPWPGTLRPVFKAYAKPLAEGLSQLHGIKHGSAPEIESNEALVPIGEFLFGAEGFGWTTCHGIGDQEPTAAFEVGAINCAQVSSCLREGYCHRWMDHPAGVVPGSKMPR